MERIKLSDHFHLDEFECPCCQATFGPRWELVSLLQRIRDQFGKSIRINRGGGCRCKAYNTAIYTNRGEDPRRNSRHLIGQAADISFGDGSLFTDEDIQHLRELFGGVGVTASRRWVHVDIGPRREWAYDDIV